jgi:hypothetical protein
MTAHKSQREEVQQEARHIKPIKAGSFVIKQIYPQRQASEKASK